MAKLRVPDLLAFLTIANLPLAAGSFGGFGGYGDAFTGRIGPFDANSTQFLEAIAASNATAVYKIPGYDVSKPYPGAPIDGWRLHLTALDMSQPPAYQFSDGKPFVGYSMTISAPAALLKTNPDGGGKIVNTDPSWGMCMWAYGHPNQLTKERYNNRANKPLAADGSCAGFLSDACIAALEKATEDAYSIASSANDTRGRFGSLARCSSLDTPDECGEWGPGNAGGAVPSYGGVPVPFLNGSVTTSDGWEFGGDAGEYYNSTKDLHEYWDSQVLNYWVLVTAMVNVTIDPDRESWNLGAGLPRVHCVAPNGEGTGKGFTFSGVVPANALNGDGGGDGGGNDAGAGNGGDDENGAELVRPWNWAVWLVLALPVLLQS
ncbi:hypothetical protein F5144DRAFT_357379 [Chaetomium tenue]|uniref:Uncharacterized protein n=1 Tax=Chaetomium tenue TaxID=1854479 RepID=A0ACB7NYN2_9PEZI|nr:hypothetical protein F5144DRAFT_357379 [Chaetomium globosum]